MKQLVQLLVPRRWQADVLRLMRFGIVGLSAFAVNWLVVVAVVSTGWMNPLRANVVAFLVAFSVSYAGHRGWTFAGYGGRHTQSFPRFALVAVIGFLVNEGCYYLLLDKLRVDYRAGLVIAVGIAAVSTYVLSACWAFGGKGQDA